MTMQWGLAAWAELAEYDPTGEKNYAADCGGVNSGLQPGEAAVVADEAAIYGLPADLAALGERLVIAFRDRKRPGWVVETLKPGDQFGQHVLPDGQAGVELVGGPCLVSTRADLAALGAWLLAEYGG